MAEASKGQIELDMPALMRRCEIVVKLRRRRWAQLRLRLALPLLMLACRIAGMRFGGVEEEE